MRDTETSDTTSNAESKPYCIDDGDDNGPSCVWLMVILAAGIFDTVTDWIAWVFLRNSLLEIPDAFQYIWLGSTIAGTVLLVIVSTKDVIIIIMYEFYYKDIQNHCWIFSEFLLFLNLILEDLPILVMTYIYVVFRTICQQFDQRLDTEIFLRSYLGLFFSASSTCLAIATRMFHVGYRMCYSSSRSRCRCPDLPKKSKLCLQRTGNG